MQVFAEGKLHIRTNMISGLIRTTKSTDWFNVSQILIYDWFRNDHIPLIFDLHVKNHTMSGTNHHSI